MPSDGWTTLDIDMPKLFFTADTHFCRELAIHNGLRNFSSVEEMNKTMIDNWNEVVSDEDHVFHLGNFSYGSKQQTEEILSQLKGQKHLIMGDADWKMEGLEDYWVSMDHYLELEANERKIVLCHYPMLVWNGSHKDSWMLHGKCHGGINVLNMDTMRHDVGVDNCEFKLLEFADLHDIFSNRSLESVPLENKRPLIYTV